MAWPVERDGKDGKKYAIVWLRPGTTGGDDLSEVQKEEVQKGCLLRQARRFWSWGLGWWDRGHDAAKATSPDDPDVMEMQLDG